MSNLSANAQRLEDWLTAEYPGQLHLSRCSCRHIGRDPSRHWSQHAGSKEDDSARGWHWECNGLDIFGLDRKASTASQRLLSKIAGRLLAIKGTYDEYGWGIFHILWNGRSLTTGNEVEDHYNHIHVDFYPKMRSHPRYVPPCKGGKLIVEYPDGTRGTDFVLWSLGGHPPDDPIPQEYDYMLPLKYGDGYRDPPDDSDYAGQDRSFRQEDVRYLQLLAGATVDGYFGTDTRSTVGTDEVGHAEWDALLAERYGGGGGAHAHEGSTAPKTISVEVAIPELPVAVQ